MPAAGWELAGYAEYARLAAEGLLATGTGDLFGPLPRAILLVGSWLLWAAVLCRWPGFLRPWFSPFPSLWRVPPWRVPPRRLSRRPKVKVRATACRRWARRTGARR